MHKQRGFTLIEIAIVLVIIGLLLGGVLKGQELITSARVRNLISQQDGIKAAYFGFLDRYRALPGDYPAAAAVANINGMTLGCTGGGGNGNGQIETLMNRCWRGSTCLDPDSSMGLIPVMRLKVRRQRRIIPMVRACN